MELYFAPDDVLQIDNARIVYRNFEGRGDQYNRAGDRKFAVVIPDQEMADALIDRGWNVKIKPPRDEEEDPFIFLPVKVKFNGSGPRIHVLTGSVMNDLDEETVSELDTMEIRSVDLDIRPYDWEVNGKTGRTAYLKSMRVVQDLDRFEAEYAEQESPTE